MGKKGKGGKKKKRGNKENKEDKMTFAEALLAYQIQIKEATINELLTEVKQVEEKNARYKERNDRLKAEQDGHFKELLNAAKDQEQELAKKEVVNREQVDLAIKQKWEYTREKERLLEEISSEINLLKKQTVEKQLERDYWLEYKNVRSKEHAKQIHLLQAEISDIKQNFEEINEYFRRNLEMTKMKISKETETIMDTAKEMATESAAKLIDKDSQREIKENDWLKKEMAIYKKDVHDLEESVYRTERENLELISHLFDCRLQDLKISRNAFLTQVVGLHVPADSLLGEDLSKLKLGTGTENISEDDDSEDLLDLTDLLYEEEKDFQAYLQLGPLEKKLLSLAGQSMPLHREDEQTENKGQMNQLHGRSKWPVTPSLIKSALP
ncbi:coiled-coil domain-containing protein 83 [Bombina bombina]|uniref:coiled-coil domain-containing protein 83 n=1 Tax=Bombina bombina TaxID=8345 RepID=UPI00235B1379|nr:coiled-coil domain-containing protein 83 [Bombina bombina]